MQTETCNFIKKETLAQVFAWEFCEIFKNTFFIEHLQWLLLAWESFCFTWNKKKSTFFDSKQRESFNTLGIFTVENILSNFGCSFDISQEYVRFERKMFSLLDFRFFFFFFCFWKASEEKETERWRKRGPVRGRLASLWKG